MKKIYSFIIITFITIGIVQAQSKRSGCSNPLSSYAFQQKFMGIQQQLNETYKLKAAINLVRINCLTSNQVKQITALFQTDESRISFAKEAYLKTYDRNQFHHVYDAFKRFRSVSKVHTHIMALRKGGTGNPISLRFPNWNYPSLAAYKGKTNCGSFMSNASFTSNALRVHRQSGENNRYSKVWQVTTTNCITTAQAMKLVSLLRQDNNRLAILKAAFDHVYDISNYSSARIALSNYNNQQEFDHFLQSKAIDIKKEEPVPCLINNNDFNEVNKRVKTEFSSSQKLRMVQTIFKAKGKCYSIAQLQSIGKQFRSLSDKLKFAKYAYDYAHTKGDYYQMTDIMPNSSYKKYLMDFLKNKQSTSADSKKVDPATCLVSNNDFNEINKRVKEEWSSTQKLSMVKTIFKAKGSCYSIAQLQSIGKQFKSSSDRLKFAKYAYDYAHKKEDYYQMADIMQNSSYKKYLMDFLKGKS